MMLTEAVENGVDSIILARRYGVPTRGHVRVVIDRVEETVEVHDDGLGFQNPIHIAEKPFDSLKRYDPDLTGKFARGIQGFRAFCTHLTFVTRRPEVPPGEKLPRGELSGRALRIGFEAARRQVELQVVDDIEFTKRTDSKTGAVAIYSDWKKGEFAKIRSEVLLQRLQHHFGELIREGNISIDIEDGQEVRDVQPVDYTVHERIPFDPIPVRDPTGARVIGEVVPELYLMDRRKRDRWLYPYILHRNRPVGDSSIGELEEFADSPCWMSPYLTGFIRADFCQINELRLALKAGYERDALYREISNMEDRLEVVLREHSKGIFDNRMQGQINDLVIELQDFLRRKKVFSFKIARPNDSASTRPEDAPISITPGKSTDQVGPLPGGVPAIVEGSVPAVPITASPGDGEVRVVEPSSGEPHSAVDTSQVNPFVGARGEGREDAAGTSSAKAGDGGLMVPLDEPIPFPSGPGSGQYRKRARKRRPRGFALLFHDDEFNDELSWFDPATSTVIINSGHQRYKQREGEELAKVKALMDYLAELYIWEITKLSVKGQESTPEEIADQFLRTKFEFFEGRIS